MGSIFDAAKKMINKVTDDLNKDKWDRSCINSALFTDPEPGKLVPPDRTQAAVAPAPEPGVGSVIPAPAAGIVGGPIAAPAPELAFAAAGPAVAAVPLAAAETFTAEPEKKEPVRFVNSRFNRSINYVTSKVVMPADGKVRSLADLPVVDPSQSISSIKDVKLPGEEGEEETVVTDSVESAPAAAAPAHVEAKPVPVAPVSVTPAAVVEPAPVVSAPVTAPTEPAAPHVHVEAKPVPVMAAESAPVEITSAPAASVPAEAAPAPLAPAAAAPVEVKPVAVAPAVSVPVEVTPTVTVQANINPSTNIPAAAPVESASATEKCYYVLIRHTATYPAVGSCVMMRSCDSQYAWTDSMSESEKPTYTTCPNCGKAIDHIETEME